MTKSYSFPKPAGKAGMIMPLPVACPLCGGHVSAMRPSGMCLSCEAGLVPRGTGGLGGRGAVCVCGASYTTPGPRCPPCEMNYVKMLVALQQAAQTHGANIGPGLTQRIADVAAVPKPLPKDDARRVDLIGWRIWRITALGYLKAITAEAVYLPGQPMVAHTEIGDTINSGSGVHVFKEFSAAAREIESYQAHDRGLIAFAIGTVQLWGEVVEHERGYRAERAMIRSIDGVVLPAKSPWDGACKAALAFLRERYGVGAHTEAPARGDEDGQ